MQLVLCIGETKVGAEVEVDVNVDIAPFVNVIHNGTMISSPKTDTIL